MKRRIILACLTLATITATAQYRSEVWCPDQGNGTYVNPVINADYSDPDVCAVGDDYYMTASSFNCIPGLPILHSKDLVNWTIIGHALQEQQPRELFDRPQHGKGVWAPSIRYHEGEYFIYWGDPDHGVFMVKARQPQGPWSEPLCVIAGKGMIDTTPLWDDGEPVMTYRKPKTSAPVPVSNPQESDEFNTTELGKQWQWHANYQQLWGMPTADGHLRLYTADADSMRNLWDAPNLLLQKTPADRFTATTKIRFAAKGNQQMGGLIIMGRDYSALVVRRMGESFLLQQLTCTDAENGKPETATTLATLEPTDRDTIDYSPAVYMDICLRVQVSDGYARFAYSMDGKHYKDAGERFRLKEGKWIGAKVGYVAQCWQRKSNRGWIDADWFRVTK